MNKVPFKTGDVVEFCGEQYVVMTNHGSSGRVRDAGGAEIAPFYWKFQGEECRLISTQA